MVLEEATTSRCDVSGELSAERGRPIRSCFVHDSVRVWNARCNRNAENVSTLFLRIYEKPFSKPRTDADYSLRGREADNPFCLISSRRDRRISVAAPRLQIAQRRIRDGGSLQGFADKIVCVTSDKQ
jgi:hypothetical protein